MRKVFMTIAVLNVLAVSVIGLGIINQTEKHIQTRYITIEEMCGDYALVDDGCDYYEVEDSNLKLGYTYQADFDTKKTADPTDDIITRVYYRTGE